MSQRNTPYFHTNKGKLVLQSGTRRRSPGHSLHPEEFGLVAALSPSLWWGARIWVDMGTLESTEDVDGNGVADPLDDLRTLKAVLIARGYVPGENLEVREIPHGRHNEANWARRIGQVLCWLFPGGQAGPACDNLSKYSSNELKSEAYP